MPKPKNSPKRPELSPLAVEPERKGSHEIVREFYEDSQKLQEEYIVRSADKQKDGLWRFFHENGQLWSERAYKEGRPWEVLSNYDAKGKPVDVGTLKGGRGVLKSYHANGKLYFEGAYEDGLAHGLWVYWRDNGKKQSEGRYEHDEEVGVWRYYNTQGELQSSTEESREDGTLYTQFFSQGRLYQEGPHRKNQEGKWEKHGLWKLFDDKGKHTHDEVYEKGAEVRRIPNPEPVRLAMEKHTEPKKQLKEMQKVAPGPSLFTHLDVLAERGQLRLSPELAVEVALSAYHGEIANISRFTEPFGESLVPALLALAREEMKKEYPDSHRSAVLPLCLWSARPKDLLPEEIDPLLCVGLRNFDTSGSMSQPTVERLRALLLTLPLKRREALVLGHKSKHTWHHGSLYLFYARTCPTDAVIAKTVEKILSWKGTKYSPNPDERQEALEALRSFGEKAAGPLIAALGGVGKKSPVRDILLSGLSGTRAPEGAATLVEFLDDTVDAARAAAIEGLGALGDGAIPALKEALCGKKKARKRAAAELLAKLPPSEETRKAAQALAPKEKDAEIKALLEGAAKGAGAKERETSSLPEGLRALRALKASITEAQREALLAKISQPGLSWYNMEQIIRLMLKEDLRALLVYTERYQLGLQKKQPELSALGMDLLGWGVKLHLDAHPELLWLAAELLLAFAEHNQPRSISSQIKSYAETLGPALAEPVASLVAKEQPQNRKVFLAWLSESAPYEGRLALLRAADDGVQGNRDLAMKGLCAAGPRVLPEVSPLLMGSSRQAAVAAEVLRALPSPESLPHLEAALLQEKNAKRRELLESARSACQLSGGVAGREEVEYAALDAKLSKRAPKKAPPVPSPPVVRWEDGSPLSEGAKKWLLGALAAEGPGEPSAELASVRKLLVDEDCHVLCEHIARSLPANTKNKWVLYQRAVLGGDEEMAALGKTLGALVYQQSAAFAAHGVEVLRRNPTPAAIRWLDHWACQGRGKLKTEARGALQKLMEAQNLSWDDLVDIATPTLGLDARGRLPLPCGASIVTAVLGPKGAISLEDSLGKPQKSLSSQADEVTHVLLTRLKESAEHEAETLSERLEAAMLTARRWTPARWQSLFLQNPLARTLSSGLLFATHDGEKIEALFSLDPNGAPLDIARRPVEVTKSAGISIPHPLLLSDAQIKDWDELLTKEGAKPPFSQLRRGFTRDPKKTLDAFLKGASLKTRKLIRGLERLHYQRGAPEDAGIVYEAWRQVGSQWVISIHHDGISASDGRNPNSDSSEVNSVSFYQEGPTGREWGEPPEALYSEALNDLREIVGP